MFTVIKINQTGAITLLIVLLTLIVIGGGALAVSSGGLKLPQPSAPTDSNTLPSTIGDQQLTLNFISEAQIEEAKIKKSPNLINIEKLPDGSTKYTSKSPYLNRPDIFIIKDHQLIYSRKAIKASPDKTLPKFATISNKFTNQPTTSQGSRYYGPFTQIKISAQDGLAVTTNPYTQEIYEIIQFAPTTVEDFKNKLGEDLLNLTALDLENYSRLFAN